MRFEKYIYVIVMIVLFSTGGAFASELINVDTYDGYQITGKLDMPQDMRSTPWIVIYVPGTGPCTYDNHRKAGDIEFNYFDLFATEFNKKGIGFFRYNTRGTDLGPNPPYFDSVDREIFSTNTPVNHARDVEAIINTLRGREDLSNAKIVLLGWSEGTVIAPLVAERNNVQVDGLFLAGYENDTIAETIEWQLTGGSSMVFYRTYFDADKDGLVSESEYDNGPEQIKSQVLQGTPFDRIDLTGDGFISAEDFKIMLQSRHDQVIKAFDNGDDDWIWSNYFRISTDWYRAHADLAPNKERLLQLDLPIYIFHGTADQNVPVEGVYDVKKRFEDAGKENLHTFIFEGYDHDLNYMTWPYQGIVSDGLKSLFDEAEKFTQDI